jgi:hypothetical protein
MQENHEANQEGGAESAAQGKKWRVPFVIRGAVIVRAETPEEAGERTWLMSAEGLVIASNDFRVEKVEEVGE